MPDDADIRSGIGRSVLAGAAAFIVGWIVGKDALQAVVIAATLVVVMTVADWARKGRDE